MNTTPAPGPLSLSEQGQLRRDVLNQAFQAFSDTTARFQEAYGKLEERVAYLTQELARKNLMLNEHILELNKTQRYLNNILEHVSDGVLAIDRAGNITTCNKAAQRITKYTAQELIHKHCSEIFTAGTTGHDFVARIIDNVLLPSGEETTIRNREGEEVPVIAYTALITGEESQVECVVVTFNDLTTIKRLQGEIERSHRLASLGEMAAGVAHEIRNPLGGIEMFASVLEREAANDERTKSITQNIIKGVRTMNKIITELLTFTRSCSSTQFKRVDIIECVLSSLTFASQELETKKIAVIKSFPAVQPVYVMGDSDQLHQVFLNLMLNAVQAITGEGGEIRIACTLSTPNHYVVVDIADNGCGIKRENLKKIFNPFYTTKAKGTGLGLAISYRIIEAHGGKITVESEEHQGTKFSIYLPLTQGE